ncbi:GNAT family N-acetyltransferase [Eubacterium sp.]|uniref:GNAT family N-acetyltransferase n=1 Tax=Eubacterium sp. TaxID=142586 RepID=UPI0025E5A87E|nr:GNAT family N-acetyltransferase [Eubacterium sp.]MCR5629849.1 GNAT family N-acetyltransferase [Eubacterium sp.]
MNIIKSNKLTEKNIKDIEILESKCRETDGDNLLVYADEDDNIYPQFNCFYMMYELNSSSNDNTKIIKVENLPDNSKLIGFLSVFQPDGYCPYVYAMVDPEHRRQGIFKALYDSFMVEFNYFKFESVSFPMHKDNETAINILKKMEGYKYSTEYILEYNLVSNENATNSGQQNTTIDKITSNKKQALTLTSSTTEDSDIVYYLEDYALGHFKRTIGSLLITIDGDTACLSHFEISKSKRNKGYGRKMLNLLCEELRAKNISKILLQVTSNNPAALHLYTSYGFTVQSELDYYNIDVNIQSINI